jgi:hypothetical protein
MGRGELQAGQAAVDGTPIDVLPLDGVGAADLRVDGVTMPASSWQGEPVTVRTSVTSGVAGPGRIELRVDGGDPEIQEVDLPVGSSSYAFTVSDLGPGFHAIEVRVFGPAESDRFTENNVYPAGHIVRDQPHVLAIASPDNDSGVMRVA